MSNGKKQDQKDQAKSPLFGKPPENVFSPSINKQPTGEKHPASPKASNVKAPSDTAIAVAREEGPFEDVDLSDPRPDEPDEPSFEMVEYRDAPHSSYNTQQDHKWKYEKDFGKDQSNGDGKEKK